MKVERTKIFLISGANYKFLSCDEQQLRFVRHHFRCWLAHLNLGAHFLDLRGLRFELASEAVTDACSQLRAGLVADTDISAAIYKESTRIIADGCVTRA